MNLLSAISVVSFAAGVAAAEPQQIAWDAPLPDTTLLLNQPHELRATASSGLPVTFRVSHGPAAIEGSAIVATGIGEITVVAEQTGDANHLYASESRSYNLSSFAFSPVAVWPAFPSGAAASVDVQADRAYVAAGCFAVFDVSDPTRPEPIGGLSDSTYKDVDVSGSFACLATGSNGLRVIDITDPTRLRVRSEIRTSASFARVRVMAGHAYCTGSAGFTVFNIENPDAITVVGELLGLDYFAFTLSEGRAYVARGSAGFDVIDISDPSAPVRLATIDTPNSAQNVWVRSGLAFVADVDALRIYDLANLSSPRLIGSHSVLQPGTTTDAVNLALAGDFVYLSIGGAYGEIHVVNISDPRSPQLVAKLASGFVAPFNLRPADGHLYVADGDGGLKIVDTSLQTPAIVGSFVTRSDPRRLQVSGTKAFLSESGRGFQMLDVSDPARPIRLADFQGRVIDAHVAGDRACVALSGNMGIHPVVFLDISNPPSLLEIGRMPLYGARGVWLEDNLACLVTPSGLQIHDIADPAAPVLLGSYSDTQLEKVRVRDGIAFLTSSSYLSIVDVTNPSEPILLSRFTRGGARDFVLRGDLAYIASASSIFQVVDISDLRNPVLLGQSQPPSTSVVLDGDYAYLKTVNGIAVVNVRYPDNPRLMADRNLLLPGGRGMEKIGDHIFLARAFWGLQTLKIREGLQQTVTFNSVPMTYVGNESLLSATATSGLPLTFSLLAGDAEVRGDRLLSKGPGPISVRADQSGNDQFLPAFAEISFQNIETRPEMTITREGDFVRISWPNLGYYVLFFGSALPFDATWTTSGNAPDTADGINSMRFPLGATPRFFRLEHIR